MEQRIDRYDRAIDEAGCPLAPLTAEQAFLGWDGVVTIQSAARTGVDPEAIGGEIKRYAYDGYFEAKERFVPAKGMNTKLWNVPYFVSNEVEQVKGLWGQIDTAELALGKQAEYYFTETNLFYGMIAEAMGMLDTPYTGTHQWRGHKRMSYEKHRDLIHEAAHWLLHDPRTEVEALATDTLTLQGCIEGVNLDPNTVERIDPAAAAVALGYRYRHLLDQVCDYCGRRFGEAGRS